MPAMHSAFGCKSDEARWTHCRAPPNRLCSGAKGSFYLPLLARALYAHTLALRWTDIFSWTRVWAEQPVNIKLYLCNPFIGHWQAPTIFCWCFSCTIKMWYLQCCCCLFFSNAIALSVLLIIRWQITSAVLSILFPFIHGRHHWCSHTNTAVMKMSLHATLVKMPSTAQLRHKLLL